VTVGYNAWLCGLVLQWVLVWVFERLDLEIDIEIRPVQMNPVKETDVQYSFDRGVLEPRILRVGEEILLVEDEQPDAAGRNIQYFRP
jgi:hypothetical protein